MAKKQHGYTLDENETYDLDDWTHIGWTEGDGTGHEGYDHLEYFAGGQAGGRYLGPDKHGIEPVFARNGHYYDAEDQQMHYITYTECVTENGWVAGPEYRVAYRFLDGSWLCGVRHKDRGDLMTRRTKSTTSPKWARKHA